jgi:hypothetical protein
LTGDRDSVDVSKLIALRSTRIPSLRKMKSSLVSCVPLHADCWRLSFKTVLTWM